MDQSLKAQVNLVHGQVAVRMLHGCLTLSMAMRSSGPPRRQSTIPYCLELTIVQDLGSHNGIYVNGDRVDGLRPVYPGDVIAIGNVFLILQGRAPAATRQLVSDRATLRQRLCEEIERAVRFNRRVSLLHVELGPSPSVMTELAARLHPILRPFDILATPGPRQLAVLLPDLSGEELAELARQLLAALTPDARAGYSTCPADGQDADTLLFLSRQAARAENGAILNGPEATSAFRSIGGREILVADPAMRRMYELLERLGPSLLPVLIQGETGSGKELAAAVLHGSSARRGHRMLAINGSSRSRVGPALRPRSDGIGFRE